MPQPKITARFVLKEGERAVTRDQILKAIDKFDEKKRGKNPDTQGGWFVYENEKRYPPKRLLGLATGLFLKNFRGREARETLRALGFELRTLDSPLRASGEESSENEESEKRDGIIFRLECDLQRALRAGIGQLENGLKISDGGKEQQVEYGGEERTAEPGRIDITAEDVNGNTVVIELKAGEAGKRAIGQILGYMGALTHTDKIARGILIADEFSPQAIAAARSVPALQLRKYSYKFAFEIVGVR